jgi:hypothetical protein
MIKESVPAGTSIRTVLRGFFVSGYDFTVVEL